jgi:putative restriction endonuclease
VASRYVDDEHDRLIRLSAFNRLEQLCARYGEEIPWSELRLGFECGSERYSWIGQQGIAKPARMRMALSITTSPDNPYRDEVGDDGFIIYHYQGDDPRRYDNASVRDAGIACAPLIYFHGVTSGRYQAFWPAFVQHDDAVAKVFHIAIDQPQVLRNDLSVEVVDEAHRRYTTQLARRRLHQAAFRARVLTAYSTRCTLCRLRHRELLDAAHILPDSHPESTPVVQNGLSLCKIHHSAFDTNIVGIRPDCVVEIRADILAEVDGPMLLHGLQEMHGSQLWLPRKPSDRPSLEFLQYRYEQFREAS